MSLITPSKKIVDANGDMSARMEAWVDLVSKLTNIDVQDEGVSVSNPVNTLNFVGGSVTESPSGQANIDISGGGGGVTTFNGLTDTPASKVTFAFDFVRVNAGETALEYHTIVPADIGAEPAFTKNTAFNKDFGTSAGTVLEGDTAFQPLDAGLTSISGLVTSADKMIYTTALDIYAITSLTSFGRSLIDDTDAATARTTLNVDQAGTDNSTNVTLAGTPNYITIVGQVITRALINLASHVTGVLGLSNGGTGDAAVTSANIGHLKAMDQDVGTIDDITHNKITSTTAADLSGGGAYYGGTTAADLLDDIKWGKTFIPGYTSSSGSGSITTDIAVGTHTKIGRRVFFDIRIRATGLGSRTGTVSITGLPFTVRNINASVYLGNALGLNITAGQVVTGFSLVNTTTILLNLWDSTAGATGLTTAELTASGDLFISGNYETD